ncbi:AAA family ATPase [Rhizobacter sp. AJA081-3]|uniref:AAA family ATPase n=1 Tax=Rhizobacter sp. AJA081-3 TaxID=2753607 RepID=UPI001ADFF442|nr:AAA family ATPase [Rhizobacter sp. AJA081-3]QTN22237.1 AAA family ATPase [Rhizobacter sp. AJA081-3]
MSTNSPATPRRPPSRRIAELVAGLRRAAPNDPTSKGALNFLELLLTHACPPAALRPLRATLLLCLPRRLKPIELANCLRLASEAAANLRESFASASRASLLLQELALTHDDTPARRLHLINGYCLEAAVSPLQVTEGMPQLVDKADSPESVDLHERVRPHMRATCLAALREPSLPSPFARWEVDDIDAALLCLRLNYNDFHGGVAGQGLNAVGLKQDFLECGQPLWNALVQARQKARPGKDPRNMLGDTAWHEMAQSRLLLSIESRIKPTEPKGNGTSAVHEPMKASDAPSLVVCRSPILRTTDRYDKDEVDRHLVLEEPLQLALMPSVAALRVMQQRLLDEFPWAGDVLAIIFVELSGQAALGVRVLGMPPTLLVGLPGSGKSRLARRIAVELGVPRLDLPLGGTSDTKVLGGTSRGWASGKPSDLATLMATRRSASAIVLLDELDKAVDYQREGSGLQSYLLALLEPETASRHTDVFLKTTCDYSGVLWLATANRLTPIAAPLVSRMRVLKLDQPEPEHFPTIAENVIAEAAQRWSLDRWALPEMRELDLPWERITSARQLRVATEQAVASWARALRRH